MNAHFSPTARQMELLRFVAGYQQAKGWTPTYCEIAAGLGVTSKGQISATVAALELRGRISRTAGRNQVLQLTVPVAIPRAPDGAPLQVVQLPYFRGRQP